LARPFLAESRPSADSLDGTSRADPDRLLPTHSRRLVLSDEG